MLIAERNESHAVMSHSQCRILLLTAATGSGIALPAVAMTCHASITSTALGLGTSINSSSIASSRVAGRGLSHVLTSLSRSRSINSFAVPRRSRMSCESSNGSPGPRRRLHDTPGDKLIESTLHFVMRHAWPASSSAIVAFDLRRRTLSFSIASSIVAFFSPAAFFAAGR